MRWNFTLSNLLGKLITGTALIHVVTKHIFKYCKKKKFLHTLLASSIGKHK